MFPRGLLIGRSGLISNEGDVIFSFNKAPSLYSYFDFVESDSNVI